MGPQDDARRREGNGHVDHGVHIRQPQRHVLNLYPYQRHPRVQPQTTGHAIVQLGFVHHEPTPCRDGHNVQCPAPSEQRWFDDILHEYLALRRHQVLETRRFIVREYRVQAYRLIEWLRGRG